MVIGVVIGTILWLLFEFNKAIVKPDYQFKTFVKLNIIPFATNLVCAFTILWFKDDIKEYFEFTRFSSVMLGMMGQGVMKKLYSIFSTNIETYVGINKNPDK